MEVLASSTADIFTQLMTIAIPIAVVWNMGTLIVSTFMNIAFGGSKWFKG